jgi:hypothetical protein
LPGKGEAGQPEFVTAKGQAQQHRVEQQRKQHRQIELPIILNLAPGTLRA